MYLRVLLIKQETLRIFSEYNTQKLIFKEGTDIEKNLASDLREISIKISEWEKSTFGEIQTYYDDAYLKILEARLTFKKHLIKGLKKISEAIQINERVKYLLNERLEIVEEKSELSEDESIVRDKEQELLEKCTNSIKGTIKLKEEIETTFKKLKEKGIQIEDLRKISDLTQEYDLDLYNIIVDTFGQDNKTKSALIETLEKIDDIFNEYEKWKEIDFKVF